MTASIIIVAGGSGLRMGSSVPKQFIELNGVPILMRTIDMFRHSLPDAKIVAVLPSSDVSFWKELCTKHSFTTPHKVAIGGKTRFESVRNGIEALENCDIVAIHDGVRPCVSEKMISTMFEEAKMYDALIPVTDVIDTLRLKRGNSSSVSVNRGDYCSVQTPQIFRYSVITEAYLQPYNAMFTDDASVVEAMGYGITLFNGEITNIKITTPLDLCVAEFIIENILNK